MLEPSERRSRDIVAGFCVGEVGGEYAGWSLSIFKSASQSIGRYTRVICGVVRLCVPKHHQMKWPVSGTRTGGVVELSRVGFMILTESLWQAPVTFVGRLGRWPGCTATMISPFTSIPFPHGRSYKDPTFITTKTALSAQTYFPIHISTSHDIYQ